MSEMYKYLEEHAYISKNKKSNYQFELSKERAECIANKHNSLCEEKDKEIERLNNVMDKFEKWLDEESEKTILSTGHLTCLVMCKSKLQELKGSGSNE